MYKLKYQARTKVPEDPRCPECGSECFEVFVTSDTWPVVVGCDCCLTRVWADEVPECYRDIENQEIPICPECGQECERLYKAKDRAVFVGCDQCLAPADANATEACFRERRTA